MKITKLAILCSVFTSLFFFTPVSIFAQNNDSEINSSNHGLHIRGALGAGQNFWGYISHGSSSGDLGTGPTAAINLAAMYNYSFLGLEFNMLSGSIGDLEWTDEDSGTEYTYKSTGTGNYNVFDFKLGAKLFTEPGDMGYTFFYIGKRFWNSERTENTIEYDGTKYSSNEKREAKGDGWIYGFRDFSTIGMDNSFAIVIQSGLFIGSAPVSKMKTDGVDQTYPEKDSVSLGCELGAGVAFQNIGFTIVGGLRGEINATTFQDPLAPAGEDSIFGFGNAVLFVEAGMMF